MQRYTYGKTKPSPLAEELARLRAEIVTLRRDNNELERRNTGLQNLNIRQKAQIGRLETAAARRETLLQEAKHKARKAKVGLESLQEKVSSERFQAAGGQIEGEPLELRQARLHEVTTEADTWRGRAQKGA